MGKKQPGQGCDVIGQQAESKGIESHKSTYHIPVLSILYGPGQPLNPSLWIRQLWACQ